MAKQDDRSPTPYLEGLVGQLAGSKFFIEGNRVVVGRDASQCQIVLPQSVISKVHAAFEVDDQQRVTLIDLSSKQSTFVNGELIDRRQLHDGDRIGFGLGGVVAFTYHSAVPGLDYRSISSAAGERNISRLVISTGPLAERQESSPQVVARQPVSSPHQRPVAQTEGQYQQGSVQQISTSTPPINSHKSAGTMVLRAAQIPVVRLGRAPDNNFILDAPSVSRYHAMLSYEDGAQPVITDLGSTNGTFINGEPLTEPRQLTPHDLIFLGGFLLHVDGRTIKQHDLSASSVTARNLTKEIDGKTILKDVTLAISPREFVGLMGPSGCGKSTLMDALNGLRPATTGQVFVNDLDLYRNFNALRRSIGYVPQRDVLHDALTVERTLYYAARLRLPEGTSANNMQGIVHEVIETVGLTEQRSTAFRLLSGGQQKRLSLGFELITKPSFLFLDEPTSPLDPESTENMMLLFRRLADEGRIVVMVTHKFEKFHEMHHIAMLTRGGRLAYFGPPRAALEYFGCKEPGDIYRYIGSRDPDELGHRFQNSPEYDRYVRARIAETEHLSRTTGALALTPTIKQEGPERRFGFGQWLTLTQRFLEIKLKDKRNTLLLLAQAPIVALILGIIVGDSLNDSKTLFIAAIISIWFGANNAIREIVSEATIYVRERLVNLKIPSYVLSKFAVLSGIALIQCFLFVAIIAAMGRLSGGDFLSLTLILYLTSLAGITMGLAFSALVNSTEKAMSILPLVLIPQLLLSGYLKPIDDVYYHALTYKPATAAQYQHYQDTKDQKPQAPTISRSTPPAAPDPIRKYEGLGPAGYAGALMVARWTIDALAHDVSIDDKKARDTLAAGITVAGYQQVFDGKSEDEIASAYKVRVAIDCGVLATFCILFLGLTMWALKRKDVL
jgi:ABC-type multidrug transport system ATPase subunit/pSer/pThr/pTyr-binding forkhead associated (FHA) protein